MKKILSMMLVLCMMVSMFVPSLAFAGTKQDVVDLMSDIYAQLTDTEKAARKAAYDEVSKTSFNPADAVNTMTTEAIKKAYSAKSMDANTAQEKVKAFMVSVAKIQYSYDTTTLNAAIENFKTEAADTKSVMSVVFGEGANQITTNQMIELFLGTYQHMSNYVDSKDAKALSQADAVEDFVAVAETLKVKIYAGETESLGIAQKLNNVSWTSETVTKADKEIRTALNAVQSGLGSNADIALASAGIRKEATLQGSTSLDVGSSVTYKLTVFGQETTLFLMTIADTNIATVSGTTVKGISTGSTEVYIHRAGISTPVAGQDFLYKFTLTVTAAADDDDNGNTGGNSGGPTGGGPTGGGAPSTPAVDNPAETNTQTENIAEDSTAVATEEQASEVLDNVTKNVTDISKSIAADATAETKQVVVDSVSNLSTAIVNSSKAVTTQAGATKVMNTTSALLGETAKVATSITDSTQLKALMTETSRLVANSGAVMSKVTDSAVANSLATDIIKSAGAVIKATNLSATGAAKAVNNQEIKKVEAQIQSVARAAIAIAGTQNIATGDVKVDSATGVGSVSVSAADLAAKAQSAVQTQKSVSTSIRQAGMSITKTIKPQVVINVPAVQGANSVETTLSGLSDVFAVVDEVKIATPTASFEIDKNSFAQDLTAPVKVSAENVSVTDLTAAQRAQVPSNAKVVDLNASVGEEKVSTFKTPVTVSLPYELSVNENPEKLSVYLLKDDGTVEAVPAKYVDGRVVFKRKGFSFYVVKQSNVTFADLGQAKWSKEIVEYLAGKGIAVAKEGNNFDPNAKITRAEFLDMLMKIAQLNGDVQKMPFTDVTADDWYATSVAAAYENKIVSGTSETTFSPNAPITRQDMAVMISKVMMADGYTMGNVSELSRFNDGSSVASYAKAGVSLVSRENVVNGTPEGNFNPAANTTRAEAAAMIYNMFTK